MKEEEKNLKKKTENLQLLIEKYKKELDNVRNDCKHPESKLKVVTKESGTSGSLRIVCVICEKIIGYPSQKDIENYYS